MALAHAVMSVTALAGAVAAGGIGAALLSVSAVLSVLTAAGLYLLLRPARPDAEEPAVEEPATVGHDLEAAEQQELAAADISGSFRLAIYRYLAKADVRQLTPTQADLLEAHLGHLVTYARKVAHTILWAQRDLAAPRPPVAKRADAASARASFPPLPKKKPKAHLPTPGDPSTGIATADGELVREFPEILPERNEAEWVGDLEAPRAPSALALLGAALQDTRGSKGAAEDILQRLQEPGPKPLACCAPVVGSSWSQLQHDWGPEQEQAARLDPTLQRRHHPRQHRPQPPPPPEWQQEEPRYVSITTEEVRGWLHEAANGALDDQVDQPAQPEAARL